MFSSLALLSTSLSIIRYQKAALRWHPDRHARAPPEEQAAAAERFTEVKAAYEVLCEGMAAAEGGGGFAGGALVSGGEITAAAGQQQPQQG